MTDPSDLLAGGIRCHDAAWLVCDARDRSLDDTERHALDTHLARCPHCKVAGQQFTTLFSLLDEYLGKPPVRE